MNQVPPYEKVRLLLIRCFYCLELEIITGQCCDILSVLTPDSAFQSALLHYCIDNTLNLSTPVIGSYKTWCIPPVIIFHS